MSALWIWHIAIYLCHQQQTTRPMNTKLRLKQHISILSFIDSARVSNTTIAGKFERLHGFSGGYISRITKDGAYVKSYTDGQSRIFLTNAELALRTAVNI